MKLKHLYTNLLLLSASMISISCDGTNTIADDKLLNNLDEVAESIEETIDNDRIDYTPTENNTSFDEVENIIFSGISGQENKVITAAIYTYEKTGQFFFDTVDETSAEDRLVASLSRTLGAPSPIGTRLRELILREEAIFTNAELIEIAEILNATGAGLFVDSDDPLRLLGANDVTFSHKVTSNNRDLLAGTMAGLYQITVGSFLTGFRAPTSAELAEFRLLTPDHKIPFVTAEIEEIRVGAGVWVLSLANGEGRPL